MVVLAEAETAQAVEELQRKQARRARWSRIGGAFLAIVVVVRIGVALFGPAELEACDASAVQTTLTDLVDKAAAQGGGAARTATFTAIRTMSGSDTVNHCTAHLTMTDRTEGTITYHVDAKNVTIDKLD